MCRFKEPSAEAERLAKGIVAMIEGGILLMKNNQDIDLLKDMAEWIRNLVEMFVKQQAMGVSESLKIRKEHENDLGN
ncbi:MAG: hypothetical protein WCD89_04190 [Anaerocolumna sp.]